MDRPHLAHSQASSRQTTTDPFLPSAPPHTDTASEVLPNQGRTDTAEGRLRAAPAFSEAGASPSAWGPSEGRASLSALPSEGRADVYALGPSDGRAHAPVKPLTNGLDAWGMAHERSGSAMAGGMKGLQAVLQDSSTALQQELRTAEAKMEV